MRSLLAKVSFGPFFWTQFLGAFNDNVFKNALVIFVSMQAFSEAEVGFWVNLASGLFILPFFALSPLAGHIAYKYEKGWLIRLIKVAEIVLMLLGALTFYMQDILWMTCILSLMGAQSAFFGPVKYSIIPQHVDSQELVRATGLVEMGTFVAILLGTILGGLLVRWHPLFVAVAVVILAVLGYVASWKIPHAAAGDPGLRVTYNPLPEFKQIVTLNQDNPPLFWTIMAISWFWFYGATVLAQMPTFTTHGLYASSYYITFFLAVFTISIAFGSMLVHRISAEKINLKVAYIGIAGLIWFLFDLGFMSLDYSTSKPYDLLQPGLRLQQDGMQALWRDWRIVVDFTLIGVFGSFFIVPLYALLQEKSHIQYRSRMVALNNILNSLFMVLSAIFCAVLFMLGGDTSDIFQIVSLVTVGFVALAYVYRRQWQLA